MLVCPSTIAVGDETGSRNGTLYCTVPFTSYDTVGEETQRATSGFNLTFPHPSSPYLTTRRRTTVL